MVYEHDRFSNILTHFGIKFDKNDLFNSKKADVLIQELVDRVCNDSTWVGAGISRSCFIDDDRTFAIKVDKTFFTHIDDEIAEEDYQEAQWTDFEEILDLYGYAFNRLDLATKQPSACKQSIQEINTYESFLDSDPEMLDYFPMMFAASSNKAVQIVEYCRPMEGTEEEYSDKRFLNMIKKFQDNHDGNFGYNEKGKLVIIDYGMEKFL